MILDRSVYSDLIFTNVVYKEGSISDKGKMKYDISFKVLLMVTLVFY